VLKKHLKGCVAGAVKGGDHADAREKIDEIIALLDRFKRK